MSMRVSGWLYLIQQTMCGLCLLLALGRAAGLARRSFPRLGAVALLAALGTLLSARAALPWLRTALAAVFMAFAPLAAWPGVPRRLRFPLCLTHLTLGMTLAGWARLLAGLGVWLAFVPFAACALLYAAVPLMRRVEHPRCVTAEIRMGSHRLTLTALIDSGNLLRDPVTGLPVIVISRRAASRLTLLPPPGRLTPGMRLISVRTIAGTTLMAVFRPTAVFLEEKGNWRAVNAIIGLSPDGYEGFQALVPAHLVPPSAADNRPEAGVPDVMAGAPEP